MGLRWLSSRQGEAHGGGFPKTLLRGRQKHLWVVLLPQLQHEGPLSRDFDLQYRWTKAGKEIRRKSLPLKLRANKVRNVEGRKRESRRKDRFGTRHVTNRYMQSCERF